MSMTSVDSLISNARTVASLKGWSKTRLAREAGLGINGLVELFDHDFNPTAATLRKVEAVVNRVLGEQAFAQACAARVADPFSKMLSIIGKYRARAGKKSRKTAKNNDFQGVAR